jgi:hypothetical protein
MIFSMYALEFGYSQLRLKPRPLRFRDGNGIVTLAFLNHYKGRYSHNLIKIVGSLERKDVFGLNRARSLKIDGEKRISLWLREHASGN